MTTTEETKHIWGRGLLLGGGGAIMVSKLDEVAAAWAGRVAADVAICLAGVLAGRGLSLGDLSRAVLRKVEVNRMRRWVRQQDGTWQHGD